MSRRGESARERRGGGLVFPIVVIVLGVVLLLQSLDVLLWSLWSTLWRFWPVLVILVGLSIVLRRAPAWVMPSVTLLALAGVIAAAIAIHWPLTGPKTYSGSFTEPLNGTEKVRVDVDFGAGKLVLGALPETSENLVEGRFSGPSQRVEATVSRRGSEAALKLSRPSGSFLWGSVEEVWDVKLSRRVAMDLEMDTGVSDVKLDLTDLRVHDFDLDAGVARLHVCFPRAAGRTEATVRAGAAELTLMVPEGVAARIVLNAAAGKIEVDEARFPRKGKGYESPGFDEAANKLALDIDSGAARVTIRQREATTDCPAP